MPVPTIAILAPGAMGAGVGARLAGNGARVLTSLLGRSEASAARAAAAGMMPATDAEIARSGIILSIVPPDQALAFAQRLAPALAAARDRPLYVDCNAISPQRVQEIAAVIASSGADFADAGIIGAPPAPGQKSPRLYASGPEAARLTVLGGLGLDIRILSGALGEASALKMCYANLTKGFTALAAASALAAGRAGVTDALRAELRASQPQMLAYIDRALPTMFSKAYRWVAEMEEIGTFLGDESGRRMLSGMAGLYERLAADEAGERREIAALEAFVAASGARDG